MNNKLKANKWEVHQTKNSIFRRNSLYLIWVLISIGNLPYEILKYLIFFFSDAHISEFDIKNNFLSFQYWTLISIGQRYSQYYKYFIKCLYIYFHFKCFPLPAIICLHTNKHVEFGPNFLRCTQTFCQNFEFQWKL